MAEFEWTSEKEEAAQLVAMGELTDEKIAEKVKHSRTSLWHWRKHPEFSARVDAHLDEIRDSLRRRAVAHAEFRLARLNRDWHRLQALIDARAEAPANQAAPGGKTGLLAHSMKSVGAGPLATVVDEWTFDAAVLKELREIEKQAAQELGQWVEKKDVTTRGNAVTLFLPDNGRDTPDADPEPTA